MQVCQYLKWIISSVFNIQRSKKEFISNLSIEDLKIYINRIKEELDLNDSDFNDIKKVGIIAFDISSIYQYKQSKIIFENQ